MQKTRTTFGRNKRRGNRIVYDHLMNTIKWENNQGKIKGTIEY